MLMPFFTIKQRSLRSTHDQTGIKLPTRLRLKFHEHELSHSFKDCVNPWGNWDVEIETTKYSFLALPIPC